MKKYLLILPLLFMTACLPTSNSNPNDYQSAVASVYTSQFPDIPVPMEMKAKATKSMTTFNADGQKVGIEIFSGNVDHISLGKAMSLNVNAQGWVLRGLTQGERTLQIYTKDTRYLIVMINKSVIGSEMELWVLNQSNIDVDLLENSFTFQSSPTSSPAPLPGQTGSSTGPATTFQEDTLLTEDDFVIIPDSEFQ